MIKHKIVAASAAASTTGLASNATGASWALTATDCGDGMAHLITVKGDMATDHSAKTMVITGTNADGEPITETINLPNGTATVTTTKYFLTVDSPLVPSATIGSDTMDVGWAAGSVSPSNILRQKPGTVFNIGVGCTVVAGSPTYSVQHTYDGIDWIAHATIASKSATFDGTYTSPVAAIRLAFAAAGSVTLTAWQAE